MEHSNLLIINYINNTIERFEPQMMDIPFGASEIDKIIQYDIVDNLNDLYDYVSSIEVSPINNSISDGAVAAGRIISLSMHFFFDFFFYRNRQFINLMFKSRQGY